MIVIKDSLRSATPHREAQGMYTSGYTFIFFAIETDRLRVDKLPTPTDSEYPKIFPQALWNVETVSVEKFTPKHLETLAVDKLLFLPFALWIKSPRESCAFGTFPHNLLLLPLLLHKPIYR